MLKHFLLTKIKCQNLEAFCIYEAYALLLMACGFFLWLHSVNVETVPESSSTPFFSVEPSVTEKSCKIGVRPIEFWIRIRVILGKWNKNLLLLQCEPRRLYRSYVHFQYSKYVFIPIHYRRSAHWIPIKIAQVLGFAGTNPYLYLYNGKLHQEK